MPAYHFEGSSDSGFQISGILEAEDKSHAQRKAQRFCATTELMLVSEIDPGLSKPHVEGIRCASRDACQDLTLKGRALSLVESVTAVLFGKRSAE